MDARTTRILTPSRIVGLALVALVIGGLAYLHFGTGSEPVSVPAGAQAGDLILERGEYSTEDGRYAADRGTLVVPENRADPQSRLIALPVIRIHAQSDHPAEPIFRLDSSKQEAAAEMGAATSSGSFSLFSLAGGAGGFGCWIPSGKAICSGSLKACASKPRWRSVCAKSAANPCRV